MRASSAIPRSQRRPARGKDPAQYVLPFLAEAEATSREAAPNCGSISEPGKTSAPGGTPVAKARVQMEHLEAPEPMRPRERRRLDRNSVPPRRPKAKQSVSTARNRSATLGRVDIISASANIIVLIEKRAGAWSAPELAELLGCTPKHIYALAKSGRMPHLRIGDMVRFDPAATAEWLRNRFIAA